MKTSKIFNFLLIILLILFCISLLTAAWGKLFCKECRWTTEYFLSPFAFPELKEEVLVCEECTGLSDPFSLLTGILLIGGIVFSFGLFVQTRTDLERRAAGVELKLLPYTLKNILAGGIIVPLANHIALFFSKLDEEEVKNIKDTSLKSLILFVIIPIFVLIILLLYVNLTEKYIPMCPERKESTPSGRGYCKATNKNDWTECLKIVCDHSCTLQPLEDQKDSCLLFVALNKRNESICQHISKEQYKVKCLEAISLMKAA